MSSASEKTPLAGTPAKYQRAPPPPQRPTRAIHLSLTILILGFVVFYAQRTGKKVSPTIYGLKPAHQPLPSTYGICTKDRLGIYTVPEESGLGAVECVVVSGKEVVDTGSLSEWYLLQEGQRLMLR